MSSDTSEVWSSSIEHQPGICDNTWRDDDGEVCTDVSTHRVVMACEHEHVGRFELCDFCMDKLLEGGIGPCVDTGCELHDCRTMLTEIPWDRR